MLKYRSPTVAAMQGPIWTEFSVWQETSVRQPNKQIIAYQADLIIFEEFGFGDQGFRYNSW